MTRPNHIDHDRIAAIAALVEREDPNWRCGNRVFVTDGEPVQRKPRSGGRKPRAVWFLPASGGHHEYATIQAAASAKGISTAMVYQIIAGTTRSQKCAGTFIYAPRTEDGRRIALQEVGSAA